ncbi:MAG: hypothetical protein LBS36_07670 [Oscillospiraceae bacterium]|jgi:hypothetical protein|nr:hypothetical protein [Oscillospiraceae bacterium]
MSAKRVKLTIVFRTCGQTGINHWSDGAYTKTLKLTEEQSKLFVDGEKRFDEIICELEEPPE